MDAKNKFSTNYCDTTARISKQSQQMMVEYIKRNPVFKLNRLADIAIDHFMKLPEKQRTALIMQYQLSDSN